MHWIVLTGAVLGFLGSVPPTGPIAILVVARSLEGCARNAVKVGLGAALPEGIYAALAYGGSSAFIEAHPIVADMARPLAALLLMALGVMLARSDGRPGDAEAPRAVDNRGGLTVGFAISAINPTLVLSWAAVLSMVSSMSILELPLGAGPAFGAGVALGVGAWFTLLAVWLGKHRNRLSPARRALIRRGLAMLVFGAGVLIAGRLLMDVSPRELSIASSQPARWSERANRS